LPALDEAAASLPFPSAYIFLFKMRSIRLRGRTGGEAQLRIADRSILVAAEITLQLAEIRSEIRETKTEKGIRGAAKDVLRLPAITIFSNFIN